MSTSSPDQETKSGYDQEIVRCQLCGEPRERAALDWWCETTPLGEPETIPVLVCRHPNGCCERARLHPPF